MSDDDQLAKDRSEALRRVQAYLKKHHQWNWGDFDWEDERWLLAIKSAEAGDATDLIQEFLVLKLTPWSRNALANLFRRYRLKKVPHKRKTALYEEFKLDLECAAELVMIRRERFKQKASEAEAAGRRREAAEFHRQAEDVLSEAAALYKVAEKTLHQFMLGKHGKKLPKWVKSS